MKGIILAGGAGSRLWPITKVTSTQLLPIYDKPMIYYPLATLMLAGVRDILIITTPHDKESFEQLLGDGSELGVNFKYCIQPRPEGLAQALILGESFLAGETCLLILGDNIFHGVGLGTDLQKSFPGSGAQIFTYEVADPTRYGILTLNEIGEPVAIEEKPKNSKSKLAVTGLYYFDGDASGYAKELKPSARGELEITSLIQEYLSRDSLTVRHLSRGAVWLDTGTPNSLVDAANYVRIIEERTGLKISCIEEIALMNGWLSEEVINRKILAYGNNDYSKYLSKMLSQYVS